MGRRPRSSVVAPRTPPHLRAFRISATVTMLLQATPSADRCTSPCSCSSRCRQQEGAARRGQVAKLGARSQEHAAGGGSSLPQGAHDARKVQTPTSVAAAVQLRAESRCQSRAAGSGEWQQAAAPWRHSRRRWACATTRSVACRAFTASYWGRRGLRARGGACSWAALTWPGVPGPGWSSWLPDWLSDAVDSGYRCTANLSFGPAEHGVSSRAWVDFLKLLLHSCGTPLCRLTSPPPHSRTAPRSPAAAEEGAHSPITMLRFVAGLAPPQKALEASRKRYSLAQPPNGLAIRPCRAPRGLLERASPQPASRGPPPSLQLPQHQGVRLHRRPAWRARV